MSILGAGQVLAAEPESLTSAPTSPIRATHSVAQDHPFGSAPGGAHGQKQHWVVSVIEKVHAHTQAGEISKMMVTGEVILTLEGTEIDPTLTMTKRALLRLEHLESLEKHVPNSAYLSAADAATTTGGEEHAQEGAYWINLEFLAQAMHQHHIAGGSSGVVVLKYQVRTTEDESRQTMIPLLIHPAWKCEPHQTSLLINYKTNANCKLVAKTTAEDAPAAGARVMAMSEVSFLVPVSGDVTNVQSRPTGIWNAESNKMFWDVENLLLKGEHAFEPKKLLARFELNTTGENAGPSQPSATAVKFRIQDQLLSDLNVLLERENENEAVEEATTGDQEEKTKSTRVAFGSVRLQVQSGRYLALA